MRIKQSVMANRQNSMFLKLPNMLLTVVVFFYGVSTSSAASAAMELKYVSIHEGSLFEHVEAQRFWWDQESKKIYGGMNGEFDFDAVIKKEPQYRCDSPMRCVASLGGRQYGFVLDAQDLKEGGFNILYFDFDHDGELTDEKPLYSESHHNWGGNTHHLDFPTIAVALKANGDNFQYRFKMSVHSHGSESLEYADISLRSVTYRVGEVELDGEKHSIGLIDYNGNGRFDDQFKMNKNMVSSDNMLYPQSGDMLLTNLDQEQVWYMAMYRPACGDLRQHLSRLANIEGRYYRIKVTPSGDKVTLTPYKKATGKVHNPNAFYRAIIYGDKGFLKINGLGGQPVEIPEGNWQLLSYMIDLTEARKRQPQTQPATDTTKQQKEPKQPKKKGGVLSFLAAAFGVDSDESDSAPISDYNGTLIYARATSQYPLMKVKEGQTKEMAFGPPLKPTAKVEFWRSEKEAHLELQIKDAAEAVVKDLQVKGKRPPAPKFEITTGTGKKVVSGKFEYG